MHSFLRVGDICFILDDDWRSRAWASWGHLGVSSLTAHCCLLALGEACAGGRGGAAWLLASINNYQKSQLPPNHTASFTSSSQHKQIHIDSICSSFLLLTSAICLPALGLLPAHPSLCPQHEVVYNVGWVFFDLRCILELEQGAEWLGLNAEIIDEKSLFILILVYWNYDGISLLLLFFTITIAHYQINILDTCTPPSLSKNIANPFQTALKAAPCPLCTLVTPLSLQGGPLEGHLIIFTELVQQSMKTTTSSGLNREQQVKVVIRLKPDDPEARFPRCVYLSDRENELVVETENKKELFLFDHIAHQLASQADIYRMIGQEVVHSSVQGFNSCVFAYGQTGAGKTYSVMGSLPDLQADHYADTRGLLPRIVEDVFNWASTHPEKCSVICSYMEVYNQQIFDLLSPEKRIHQIREDFKRGVFVEGLIEKRITSYRQGIEAVLEGEKTRRMASTAMNTESSRSHAIFTLTIQTEVMEDDVMRIRRSKLNIVDLAGSERVKHTHVMGEQLKEGCNINRSLHVLGNVINSLVESAKKKKHIPFRDSKLTHYLKDSLGGNSLTKLLANIHTNKLFLGDTLSTLMFAKRAKSLKMKVEVNQNITENFDSLRKQVKRLREELAQARYFKGETQRTERPSFEEDSEMTFEKITETHIETAPKTEIIQVFQENELHYKALIQVYEQHLASCNAQSKGKQPLNMVGEWKNLQKKNTALAALVRRFPAFTKIYKENLMLRQQERNATILEPIRSDQKQRTAVTFATDEPPSPALLPAADRDHIQRIVHHYQALMHEMQTRFQHCLQTLQKSYNQLQAECRQKDKRLKESMRKVDLPPDVQDLKNQNQYLHLNILNLENEICQIHQHDKLKQERKEHKRTPHRSSVQQHENNDHNQQEMTQDEEPEHAFFMSSLQAIKEQMQRDMHQVEKEREETDALIEQLKKRVSTLMVENQNLKMRTNRSRSQRRAKPDMSDSRASSTNNIKSSFSDLLFLEESAITSFSKKTQSDWEEQMKGLHQAHRRELQSIQVEMAGKEQQIDILRTQLKDSRTYEEIEEQFGKKIIDILQEYRQNARRLGNTRSMANIRDFKQPVLDLKIQQKPNKKVNNHGNSIPESRVKAKEEGSKAPKQARTRRQELGVRNPMINAKKPFFSSK